MKAAIVSSVVALALAACDSTPRRADPNPVALMPRGPVTAYPDVEVFGENPLSAFQRTGSQPLPIATLPVGTALQVHAKSGAFYQITTPDMRGGWVAARSVAGVTAPVPDFGEAPQVAPTTGSGTGGMPAGTGSQPDTIDLDRMP